VRRASRKALVCVDQQQASRRLGTARIVDGEIMIGTCQV
jgi:hypothetical protein